MKSLAFSVLPLHKLYYTYIAGKAGMELKLGAGFSTAEVKSNCIKHNCVPINF